MKLNINGEELELVYSFRINLFYEEISNKSLDFTSLSANDLVNLFYSTVIASLQKAKRPNITMLEFLDVIDDNGGEKVIVDFSNWFIEVIKGQYEILPDDDKKTVDKKKKD
jgi:hypothetical protein